MKKILLFVLLILSNLIIQGQNKNPEDYLPMAVENAQWTIFVSDNDDLPPFNEHYYGYRIEGDTIINGTTYKKVYRRDFVSVNPDLGNPLVGPFVPANEYLFGVIRDDVLNKKIFGIQYFNGIYNNSCVFDEEFLMYDFNMDVGDSYSDFCLFEDSVYYIGELTQENIFDENRNVQIVYNDIGDTFTLRNYEGIGSSVGLFEPIGIPLGCPCVNLSNYCVGTDQECLNGFILRENELVLDKNIKIYPNPVKNIITIENKLETNYNIKIYTILGKLIVKKKLSNTINNIDVSNLKKGIYLLKYNNTLHKIIKQ